MVRKWSYLNSNILDQNQDYLNNFTHKHRFKVFRASTRFKKFNVGTAKVVRKLYARQKRRTNSILLTFITADWLRFVSKSRQLYRFLQAYGAFNLNVSSSNTSVLTKRISSVLTDVEGGVNSYACTKKALNAILNRHPYYRLTQSGLPTKAYDGHFLRNKTGFSGNSGLMTTKAGAYEVLTNLGPNSAVFDRLTYPYDLGDRNKVSMYQVYNSTFTHITPQVVCVRQILIHLTLLNALSR